jgi:hypothetical protein
MCAVLADVSVVLQENKPPGYNWNIVENGVKHHKPTNFTLIEL